MKAKNKYLLFLLIPFAVAGILLSCSDDELANGGDPTISYIRVTDPASSDSLLVMAGQGQMVAIMGQNLKGARQLWFNDQRATLNPSFITNTTIITRVPSQIPTEINNSIRIIFANGKTLEHDFSVDISEPEVSYMSSEFVNEGDIATINGNYFYEPVMVTFTGGVDGEIVSRTDQLLEVRVPAGAQPGPITVSTNFGATPSEFFFRDNRFVFGSMDSPTSSGWWHGADKIVASDPDIPAISNKFLRVKNNLSVGQWYEFFVGTGGDMAQETKKIPAEAILKPEDYNLKFEINTLESLAGAKVRIYIGNDMGGERNANNYTWLPNVNTGGKWETISIPFSEILAKNPAIKVDPNGYGISFWFWESTVAVKANFALDNVRVVPVVVD
jgi:hypothetical protein